MMKSFIHSNDSAMVSGLLVAVVLTISAAYAIIVSLYSILLSTDNTQDSINTGSLHTQLARAELQSGAVLASSSSSSLYSPSSQSSSSHISNVKIAITSQQHVHGVAGQFVKIKGSISNTNPNEPVKGGIGYISLVDIGEKIPVDLEDWSAQKGLYIPSIAPGQTLPLEWDVRLVKAGLYTVDILFNSEGDFTSPPSTSSKIFLEVSPKLNLNPGNVLPVAFGVPAVLMTIFGAINYTRGRKMGIYK